MSSLNSEIVISTEKRPCTVNGEKAIFHNWCEVSYPIGESVAIGGPPAGQITYPAAIVEYEDGSIKRVSLHESKIMFVDGLVGKIFNENATFFGENEVKK